MRGQSNREVYKCTLHHLVAVTFGYKNVNVAVIVAGQGLVVVGPQFKRSRL
jgi:hypothetical protein